MQEQYECACLTATGNCTAHLCADKEGKWVGLKKCNRTAINATTCIDYYPASTSVIGNNSHNNLK